MKQKRVTAGCIRQLVVLYIKDQVVWEFAWADSALVFLDEWSSYRGGCFNRFDCNTFKLIQNNFVYLMEKWVQIFKCIISHSSTKSLVPPLHKFTIWSLDLFFPFFWETYQWCVLNDLSIFRDGKKIVPLESTIAFCLLFIAWVKKVCYERKVRKDVFFIVHWSVATHMFLLYKL